MHTMEAASAPTKEFHDIAFALDIDITLHPPTSDKDQAICEGWTWKEQRAAHLQRNRNIVDAVQVMIACPRGFEEELRSGTWATIRYARKVGRKLYIIYPDGRVDEEL
jgi:hypothetical protein